MTQDILINNQHGRDDVERATITMTIAGVAAMKGCQTVMFLTCGGLDLALKGGAEGIHLKGYPAVDDLIDSYSANGGKFWVCKAGAAARGITQEDLIESATLAGATDTISYLEAGANLLI